MDMAIQYTEEFKVNAVKILERSPGFRYRKMCQELGN